MNVPLHASFSGRLWLDVDGTRFLGKGRVQILTLIGELGSITRAAKAMGMSYKAAWEAVETMNRLADAPLVTRVRGGAGGGESRLTEYGEQIVRMFDVLQEEHMRFLRTMTERLQRFPSIDALVERFAMKTSARNQFWGKVASVKRGAVNAEVALNLGDGETIVASITNGSVDALDLKPGKEACALIKASFVLIVAGESAPKTSARNTLRGTVSACKEGAVNGEVTIALKGGRAVTATITNESIRALELKVGVAAAALIKASSVILAVQD